MRIHFGETPLHFAICLEEDNNLEMLKLILDQEGVIIDAKNNHGETPLHIAIKKRLHKISESLIEKRADVNAKDNEGRTLLHYVNVFKEKRTVNLLITHGAKNTNTKDKNGLCILDCNQTEIYPKDFFKRMNFKCSYLFRFIGFHNQDNIKVSYKEGLFSVTYPGCFLQPCVSISISAVSVITISALFSYYVYDRFK